jgi:putative ATP-dependent endonuclease of OLD family
VILKRAHIKNFRSIRDCEVEFGNHTSIVGGNGAGKSTILRAIERFYSQSNSLSLDDFFGGSTNLPIEIELTFTDLNDDEAEQFESRLHGGELSVVRIFDPAAAKQSGKYYGRTQQHPPFAAIRSTAGATEKRAAYNALRAAPNYVTLPPVTGAAQIDDHLKAWEDAHPDEMALTLDDGQFLGFTNVGRGSLQRHTKFVFIPAVREASADAQDGKGAVVAELMELVVRSAIEKRAEIRDFRTKVSQEYKEMTSPERLTELGDLSGALTNTLKRLYLDAAVNLKWRQATDLALPLPLADVLLDDDGFEGPVDRKGHGLQRALILTLLQHLAHASATAAHAEEAEAANAALLADEGEQLPPIELAGVANDAEEATAPPVAAVAEVQGAEDGGAEALPTDASASFVLPGLILAIEEPELYQHPTKQRHFAKVLHDLSAGALPGVAARTQVMFASHSSLFVSAERFDEIRLARRQAVEGTTFKECVLTCSTLEAICRKQEVAFGEAEGTRTVEGLRSRLHVVGAELSEGFFADVAVVVEGASDRAALVATAELMGSNFEENGIAILIAGGKTAILNPVCIFQELQIPTYFVWDSDKGLKDDHVEYNHALQRLSGIANDDLADHVQMTGATGACFEMNLETTLRAEFGTDVYDKLLDDAAAKYGLEGRRGVSKSPAAMREVMTQAQAQGHTAPTVTGIVEAILALSQSSAPAVLEPEPHPETVEPKVA